MLLAACVPTPEATSSATDVVDTTLADDSDTATGSTSSGTSTTDGWTTTTTSTTNSTTASTEPTTSATSEPTTTTGDTDATSTTDDTTTGTTGQQVNTCKKVDFLFFIDNVGDTDWGAGYGLGQMIPHLAERIEKDFADWDYHMMVIKGDDTWGNAYCEQRCEEGGDPCSADYPCADDPDACDLTLGSGVTHPAGGGASNKQCPIDGEQRYIQTGQTDLAGTLDCMSRTGSGWEFPGEHRIVRSILDSINTPLNAPGACNDGFFREDAYLILFVISPLPDIYATGTPDDWTKELKAHKGGKFDKIHFTGLFESCGFDYGKWKYDPLKEWVSSLYHHQLGHTCTDDLIKYIDPALDYLQTDCQE